ncbi:NnrU family protein [Sneathiella chinensis]|uniref:NnrU protein n=1 Tax=Sneathiella chinensis TaxID=349750 RepID=A0ABQ5U492_9PROT|nr:NnrU family protein [Sneathiella chinensis]GLQ06025.1 NnrU protein [Sneathiella chinensis]
MTGTMSSLWLASIAFLALHIIPSSFLREKLVSGMGLRAYLIGYSLLSGAAFVWMIMAFVAAPYGDLLWQVGNWGRYGAIGIMVVASILLVSAYATRSPTAIGGEKALQADAARHGMHAVTRHPLMWSLVLWAVAHLLNNGDVKSVIFFVTLGGLALAGTFLIDVRRARDLGADWQDYAAHTSNIPFAALLTGRASISVRRVWWQVLLGLVVFMAFFHLHTLVIGVSPFPL